MLYCALHEYICSKPITKCNCTTVTATATAVRDPGGVKNKEKSYTVT